MVNVKTALFLLPLATYVRGRPIDLELTAQDIEDSTVCNIENLAGCDDEDLAVRGIQALAARGDEGLASQSDDGMGRSYNSASVRWVPHQVSSMVDNGSANNSLATIRL